MKKWLMKGVNKLTNIGGSLQTPIAILPAAGILLALGTIFTSESFLEMMPFADTPAVTHIFNVCLQCGNIIFNNLPLIFAAGVAIGLSNNDGVAALSAIVGYLIMNVTVGGVLGITEDMVANNNAYTTMLGIPTLQTGVLGGIIIGVLASSIYKKFYRVKLPQALEFFAGKRSVPILTAFSAFFIGLIMCVIWPPIQGGIDALSSFIANSNAGIAGFMFGFVERLTIPFGMNHVWWPTFWLQAGEYVNQAGNVVHGDQLIFFAQLADNAKITAGTFMNGLFVLKMFSMPACALAMYKCAKPKNREKVYGIMMSGALTAFFCGITEPLEFSFIFCAPMLLLVHAVITGLGFTIMNLLGAHLGLSFSGGFLDYLFFNILPNRTNWWIVIPIGIIFFAIYYFAFTFAITKFNLMTPGRGEESKAEEDTEEMQMTEVDLISRIIVALGGKDNITNVNACFSRLRVDVKNPDLVKKSAFKNLQNSGISILGQNVQVIYGNRAVAIKEGVLKMLRGEMIAPDKLAPSENPAFGGNPQGLGSVVSPGKGRIMEIGKVPDKVFREKTLGDGFAVKLEEGNVVSPVKGKVISIFETKHAICLVDEEENEVLVHIGLDTVTLKGKGIQLFVKEGDLVKQGQKLAEVDLDILKTNHLSSVTPIIFSNMDMERYHVNLKKNGKVLAGETDMIEIAE